MRRRLSLITPAYNEELNIPVLYRRLVEVLDQVDMDWEWIVTDDHSSDRTFDVLSQISQRDGRVRAFRFSRNFFKVFISNVFLTRMSVFFNTCVFSSISAVGLTKMIRLNLFFKRSLFNNIFRSSVDFPDFFWATI